jgi:hypothetical protein
MTEKPNESEDPKSENSFANKLGGFAGTVLVVIIILTCFYALFKVIALAYNVTSPYYGRTNQKALRNTIFVAINNQADLSAVKTLFNNREIDKSLYSRWFVGKDSVYLEPINLASILEDMRAAYFISEKRDENFLFGLEALIKENAEVNPFDKLQLHQKDYFTNIRIKLKDQYSLIENDIIKVSDELNKQNELVKKYLSDATTSLVISYVGLFIALLVGISQILQNKKKRMLDENKHLQLLEKLNEN